MRQTKKREARSSHPELVEGHVSQSPGDRLLCSSLGDGGSSKASRHGPVHGPGGHPVGVAAQQVVRSFELKGRRLLPRGSTACRSPMRSSTRLVSLLPRPRRSVHQRGLVQEGVGLVVAPKPVLRSKPPPAGPLPSPPLARIWHSSEASSRRPGALAAYVVLFWPNVLLVEQPEAPAL